MTNNTLLLLNRIKHYGTIFFTLFALAACTTIQTPSPLVDNVVIDKESANEKTLVKIKPFRMDEYKISSGDELSIEVFGEPDLTRPNITVPNNGEVDYPLIGKVNLLNKTLYEASDTIKKQLAQGFLYQPQVTVKIEKFRPVVVTGIVENSGLHDYIPNMTYRMLLILADDGRYEWPVEDIVVQRNKVQGTPSSIDDTLAPGDLVIFKNNVQNSGERFFYVDGEVKKPGRYEIENDLTLEQAIISAGGLTVFGSRNRVFVRENGESDLRKAKLTDLVVPGNVIIVKQSLF